MNAFKISTVLALLIFTEVGHADPLDNWTWRYPVPPSPFTRFAYGNGQFVAVGRYGTIATSTDGVSWVGRQSGTNKDLSGIAFGNGQFVAVGGTIILTSTDGVNWTQRQSGLQEARYAIAYGGGQFVAVGADGADTIPILTSADGVNWSKTKSGPQATFYGVAYGNGQFVAVGYGGCADNRCKGTMVTSTDGVNWVVQQSGDEDNFFSIAYGNGQFAALGRFATVATSVDGANWVVRQSGPQNSFNGIAYGNGQFVAVGDSSTILTSVDDGVTWVQRESGTTNSLGGIAYGNGQFAAFGLGYTTTNAGGGINLGDFFTFILTSADGVNWVQRWSGKLFWLTAIAYGNATFVAVGRHFTECGGSSCGTEGAVVTSADGVNWVEQQGVPYGLGGIGYGNGRFVAVESSGIWTSADGVHWQRAFSGVFCNFCLGLPIAYGNGHFVALGGFDGGFAPPSNVFYEISGASPGGLTLVKQQWEEGVHPAIAYGNGQFVAVVSSIDQGTIQRSADGLNWTSPETVANFPLRGIAFGNGRFVAVSRGGEILQSGSIINLEIRPNTAAGLLSLSLEGPTGLDYTIQTSTDLISWRDAAKITSAQSNKVILDGLPATSERLFYRAFSQ